MTECHFSALCPILSTSLLFRVQNCQHRPDIRLTNALGLLGNGNISDGLFSVYDRSALWKTSE